MLPPRCTVVLSLRRPDADPKTPAAAAAATTAAGSDATKDKILMQQHLHFHRPEENGKYRAREQSSACFWCTEGGFPPEQACFIPLNVDWDAGKIDAYGHFCSPNCALAYLREERLESHELYLREHWLHDLYRPRPAAGLALRAVEDGDGDGEARRSEESPSPVARSAGPAAGLRIRPAPNPRFFLSKFCGTLSIDEFRALGAAGGGYRPVIQTLPWTVTKWFPELHEISDDALKAYYGDDFRGYRNGRRSRLLFGGECVPVS